MWAQDEGVMLMGWHCGWAVPCWGWQPGQRLHFHAWHLPLLLSPPGRRISSPRSAGKAFSTKPAENGFAIQFYPSATPVILMEPLSLRAGWSQRTAAVVSQSRGFLSVSPLITVIEILL